MSACLRKRRPAPDVRCERFFDEFERYAVTVNLDDPTKVTYSRKYLGDNDDYRTWSRTAKIHTNDWKAFKNAVYDEYPGSRASEFTSLSELEELIAEYRDQITTAAQLGQKPARLANAKRSISSSERSPTTCRPPVEPILCTLAPEKPQHEAYDLDIAVLHTYNGRSTLSTQDNRRITALAPAEEIQHDNHAIDADNLPPPARIPPDSEDKVNNDETAIPVPHNLDSAPLLPRTTPAPHTTTALAPQNEALGIRREVHRRRHREGIATPLQELNTTIANGYRRQRSRYSSLRLAQGRQIRAIRHKTPANATDIATQAATARMSQRKLAYDAPSTYTPPPPPPPPPSPHIRFPFPSLSPPPPSRNDDLQIRTRHLPTIQRTYSSSPHYPTTSTRHISLNDASRPVREHADNAGPSETMVKRDFQGHGASPFETSHSGSSIDIEQASPSSSFVDDTISSSHHRRAIHCPRP
ncbi:hypothetical protein BDN71DRAFT_1514304 [Pleurotus eryngii]|uniref:Uncharacterized protein n=1 Tax=Pleurotus eryngii TaxID=5323 RepID=A0A9P6D7Y7_PLEER|nr:hypothetical protein BDN71DRAFT_1514304 [Pleurotus eryngii]